MGWWINGIAANDLAGYAVASAGDVYGDGMDDIIISAYTSDPGGRIDAGQVYVIFGASHLFQFPSRLPA
ncbi:MAG: integrin alpha [Candidatus Midichloria sp.]|nr:integrin alpha [Candidatus Midichloria sp.]